MSLVSNRHNSYIWCKQRFMRVLLSTILFLIIICFACNSDEEPCPQYPARYVLDLMEGDLRIDLIHEVIDGALVPLDINMDELNAELFTIEDYDEAAEGLFWAITLIDEATAEFTFREDDGTEEVATWSYTLKNDRFYNVDLDDGNVIVDRARR